MTSNSPTPDSSAYDDGARPAPPVHLAQPVSFVRRGSRLQGRRQQAWDEYAPTFAVDLPRDGGDTTVDPDYVFDAAAAFGRTAPLVVEIGSGLGEAVCHAAEQNPERNFLALEVYRPGLAQTLLRIGQRDLANVRVAQVNAPDALATMLPESSLSELWVFFPDPWHKTRHQKRRLVQESFVELAARVLRPGGIWRLATDWSDYAIQNAPGRRCLAGVQQPARRRAHRCGQPVDPGVESGVEGVVGGAPVREGKVPVSTGNASAGEGMDDLGGWAPRFDGRTMTSFEQKAHDAGRMIFDLAYRRN